MTIVIDDQILSEIPSSVKEIFCTFTSLSTEALKFTRKQPLEKYDPHQILYVTQKEYAVVNINHTQFSCIGSDDATTCHIVVIFNSTSGLLSVAHIDSANKIESLTKIVADVIGLVHNVEDPILDLYMVGGYADERSTSETLTLKLLQFYHHLPIKFKLNLLCVGEVNTEVRNGINWPIVYGVSVSFSFNRPHLHPAYFALTARGPCMTLRSSRFLGNDENLHRIYHGDEGILTIQPFKYMFHPKMFEWMHKSDEFILDNFSSSPAVEPAHFSAEMRKIFEYIVKNPLPITVFKANKPLNFCLSQDGVWEQI